MILSPRITPYLFTDLECINFPHIYPLAIQTIHNGLGHGLEEKFIVMELCFCISIMLTVTYLLCNRKINVIECL